MTRCRFDCTALGMVNCGLGCAINQGICGQVVTSQAGDVVSSIFKSVATMSAQVNIKDFQAGTCAPPSL